MPVSQQRTEVYRRSALTDAPISLTFDKRDVAALLNLVAAREEQLKIQAVVGPRDLHLSMARDRMKSLRERLESARAEQLSQGLEAI